MKNKMILLLFAILVFKISSVSALTYDGCDYSTISRMKSLVTNINISYDYKIVDGKAYFDVTLTNVFPNVYFVDSTTRYKYTYDDTNNGEITIRNYEGNSGNYKFYVALNECYGTSLGTKYYKFPSYNAYYESEFCEGISNFGLCQKWATVNYSRSEFEKLINDYKKSLNDKTKEDDNTIIHEATFLDKLVKIYVNNYYYFLIAIILVCTVIMIISRRKNRFKL